MSLSGSIFSPPGLVDPVGLRPRKAAEEKVSNWLELVVERFNESLVRW